MMLRNFYCETLLLFYNTKATLLWQFGCVMSARDVSDNECEKKSRRVSFNVYFIFYFF